MTWVRIDDDIVDNPKTLRVWKCAPEAFALDVRAIAYCAKHLTDGIVPDEILEVWYTDAKELRRLTDILVEKKRWDPVDGGFEIHDYLDYNKSRVEVEEERAKRAVSGRRGGKNSGRSRREKVREEIGASLDEAS